MGCRSDYMEPDGREIESKRVCQLLQYLLKAANISVTSHVFERIEQGAKGYYGKPDNLDVDTELLCSLLKKLPKDALDKVVYNGRNPEARKLADWWEAHQAADAEREAEEKQLLNKKILQDQALKKLTPEEINALEDYF